jgi:hypothetical protein
LQAWGHRWLIRTKNLAVRLCNGLPIVGKTIPGVADSRMR